MKQLNMTVLLNKKEAELAGIGGWLILPMLGLISIPIRMGFFLVTDVAPLFSEETWEAVTTPGSEVNLPLGIALLVFEILCTSCLMIYSIVVMVLFFKRHYLVPKLMIIIYAVSLSYAVVDFSVAFLISDVAIEVASELLKEFIRPFFHAAIWIPYFLKSRRVRNTFTQGMLEQAATDNP